MGSFRKYAYSEGRWSTDGPTAVPFLLVDVHDSRIATVDYRATDASGGRFYLGYEPRFYFDEPDAGHPVDTAAESEGFAAWARDVSGAEVDRAAVAELFAPAEDGVAPVDETVEPTLERLLALAGLPTPDWGSDDDEPPG